MIYFFILLKLHYMQKPAALSINFRVLRMNIMQVSFSKTLVNCQNMLLYKTRKVFEPAFYFNLFSSNIFCLISGGKIVCSRPSLNALTRFCKNSGISSTLLLGPSQGLETIWR